MKGRSIARWVMSTECVCAAGAMSTAELMASGVRTLNWLPHVTALGAAVMVGRGPLNRYGGS